MSLVVLAATATACNDADAKPEADGSPSASASAAESGEPSDGSSEEPEVAVATEPSEPEEPIMIGDSRYVSPCQVLPPRDMLRLYPRLRVGADVDQTILEASPDPKQVRDDDGVVVTRCRLNLADPGGHKLEVEVDQFLKPTTARLAYEHIRHLGTGADSAQLRADQERLEENGLGFLSELARGNERDMGGHPVAGAPKLLYVPGHHDYVTQVGNLLVRMRYDTIIESFGDKPLTAAQYAQQTPLMVRAARMVQRNGARPATSQAPYPTVIGPEKAAGPTPYVEPCALLDLATATEMMHTAPTEPTEVTSLDVGTKRIRESAPAKRPYAGTSSNSCSRSAVLHQRGETVLPDASLEIRYLADPSQARAAMEDWTLMQAFLGSPDGRDLDYLERAGYVWVRDDTAADYAWTTDSKYTNPDDDYRGTSVYFAVGGYLMRLEGSYGKHGKTLPIEPEDYYPLIEQIVAKLPVEQAETD